MKIASITLVAALFLMVSCQEQKKQEKTEGSQDEQEAAPQVKEAMLSQQQYKALDMKIAELEPRLMTGFVQANGHLEIPPQNEASVTPVIGGNLSKIMVIEGQEVDQGEVLAYLEHPDIISIQTQYLQAGIDLELARKEFERQQRLYEAGVSSGELFQRSKAAFENTRGKRAGLRAQLRQLNIDPAEVEAGNIQDAIPIRSPIEGAVQSVEVKTGQYVPARTSMFHIINSEHVHVDLMVFEQDVARIEKGQKVYFTVTSLPGTDLQARIISISKNFEQAPKALHVHAEIINNPHHLIPGMYVRGKIAVGEERTLALPESAIAKEGDKFFAFSAEREGEAWSFKPKEIIPGVQEGEWVEISFLNRPGEDQKFAYNNAYYLMAEMNKGEGGHSH